MKTAIELIAEERQRQISEEGWTPEHDDQHVRGELASAGSAYALAARDQVLGLQTAGIKEAIGMMYWPGNWDEFKPTPSPVRNLVKACALLAAEIDRLQRARP